MKSYSRGFKHLYTALGVTPKKGVGLSLLNLFKTGAYYGAATVQRY